MKSGFSVLCAMIPLAGGLCAANLAPGSLASLDEKGQPKGFCPLKHTAVQAEITGFLARVTVTQDFENTFTEKIEAVYTFPLPHQAAVDDMTMLVGNRTVRGKIKRREEARAIYEAARAAGHVAGLLDQERPNIFTQSVANIMPGEKVKVTISYVEMLKYEEGSYEFSFPMVVGPRYIPGTPVGRTGGGWSPDTTRVPDASRITPPVTPPGTRAGHDVAIEVALDAGVPIDGLAVKTHETLIERPATNRAVVRLKDKAVIPNKDFILRFDVTGRKIESAVLTHRAQRGGFFTVVLAPPERVTVEDVTPKELVFVLDTSGSMSGFPIEKAKETMKMALEGLYPRDTFNLITFSGDTRILFPEPVPATPENLRKAQEFLASRAGGGGTEMMKAIRAALEPSDTQGHIRIACFMTDGFVGNDTEIIGEVQRHPNARVFAFGIGSSVNRFLLSKMAESGRGEVEFVGLKDDGSAAAKRFHERVRNPLLTDVSVDWGKLPVTDVYPKKVPDLFSAKPVILYGRYSGPASGIIRLRGKMSGREFSRDLPVTLPASEPQHDVLATLWARTKIDDLMNQDYQGVRYVEGGSDVREQVTQLGLDYRLMTQYTSFVAVEEMVVTEGGQPRRIDVPVEMPEGVSYEGVFGTRGEMEMAKMSAAPAQGMFRRSGGLTWSANSSAPPPPMMMERAARDYARPASPEEQKRLKLHPSLTAVVERLKKPGTRPAPEEAKFVRNGKAEIQVWLSDTSPETLKQLKALGFEIVLEPKTARMVIGRLPIEKLAALAELKGVRYIAPQTA